MGLVIFHVLTGTAAVAGTLIAVAAWFNAGCPVPTIERRR